MIPAARVRRHLDGVLLLDKPSGITSNKALRFAQWLYGASKAGHTGTLDPLATGLLPVCFGEATKFSHGLLGAEKSYHARIRLGVTTTTGDLEGEVTARAAVAVARGDAEEVLARFLGEIMQAPPMYSAVKKGGQPLYRLARAGHELPRTPRKVVVKHLRLEDIQADELVVTVTCSKGTYIRVLAEDIGRALGCGACLSSLRRWGVGGFRVEAAATLAQLEGLEQPSRDALLLPPDVLVSALPRFDLDAEQARRIARGQALPELPVHACGLLRIYGPDRRFMGVAEATVSGIIPRRLRAQPTG